jgi:hypothetical protein
MRGGSRLTEEAISFSVVVFFVTVGREGEEDASVGLEVEIDSACGLSRFEKSTDEAEADM